MDNSQFQMGQAMRIQSSSFWHSLGVRVARLYLTQWKGFRVHFFGHFFANSSTKPQIDQMVAATCLFEGSAEEVETERTRLFGLSKEFGGFRAPDENGQFGYRLTFAIAYLRDLGLQLGMIGRRQGGKLRKGKEKFRRIVRDICSLEPSAGLVPKCEGTAGQRSLQTGSSKRWHFGHLSVCL
jgi:hypothetical protein